MSGASYAVEKVTAAHVIIRDENRRGYQSVTNAAEDVVRELAALYPGRRIFYYDTMGRLDELVHEGGTFVGFAPGGPEGKR